MGTRGPWLFPDIVAFARYLPSCYHGGYAPGH
jgi:hypothetical protein